MNIYGRRAKINRAVEDPHRFIIDAMIVLAVRDYERLLKRKVRGKKTVADIKELEQFFQSTWFATLTDLDGIELMGRIREEAR